MITEGRLQQSFILVVELGPAASFKYVRIIEIKLQYIFSIMAVSLLHTLVIYLAGLGINARIELDDPV